jgi:hypothetical protein
VVERGLRDVQMVKRLMESAKGSLEARDLKNELHSLGYTYAMSLYGVLTNIETHRSEYRRIEVLLDVTPNERIVNLLYRFFQTNHPIQTYSIWVYDSELDSVKLMMEVP